MNLSLLHCCFLSLVDTPYVLEWICALSLLMILAGKIPSVDGKLGSNQQARTTVEESNREDGYEATTDEQGNADDQYESIVVVMPTFKIPEWKAMQPLVVASSSVFVRSFMLQLSIAGAAAMATRSGDGSESTSANSIAAHQIALQLWLLCSFVCDALAAASQALVADRLGRDDSGKLSIYAVCISQKGTNRFKFSAQYHQYLIFLFETLFQLVFET